MTEPFQRAVLSPAHGYPRVTGVIQTETEETEPVLYPLPVTWGQHLTVNDCFHLFWS